MTKIKKQKKNQIFGFWNLKFGVSTNMKQGFTLVEMIVAIFIFSVVMVIATGSLVSILEANRKAQAVKSVMNNLTFSLESMTRTIRVGTDYDCSVSNCAINGSPSMMFVDTNGREIEYNFNENEHRIERSIDGGPFHPLTAPEVTISSLTFYVDGVGSNDDQQPRGLIVVKGIAGTTKAQTNFNLQTLVSQRTLDR